MDITLVLAAAVVMIAVGLSFLYMLLGRRPGWRPGDAMEWIGSMLSVALIVSAVVLIGVALDSADRAATARPAMLVAPGATQPEFNELSMDIEAGNFSYRRVDDGSEETLQDLQGNVVLVNFWGTWCGPCLNELPHLNRLQRDYETKGLVVLSVSDEDRATLSNFGARFGLDTRSVQVSPYSPLPPPFQQAFEIRPTSYVLGRDGRVKKYLLGARSYEIFERAITPFL